MRLNVVLATITKCEVEYVSGVVSMSEVEIGIVAFWHVSVNAVPYAPTLTFATCSTSTHSHHMYYHINSRTTSIDFLIRQVTLTSDGHPRVSDSDARTVYIVSNLAGQQHKVACLIAHSMACCTRILMDNPKHCYLACPYVESSLRDRHGSDDQAETLSKSSSASCPALLHMIVACTYGIFEHLLM